MGRMFIKIIISAAVLAVIAGAIIILIYVAPKTEVVLYSASSAETLAGALDEDKIKLDIANKGLDFTSDYLQALPGISGVDVNNYYNIFDKTAFSERRIFIKIVDKSPK